MINRVVALIAVWLLWLLAAACNEPQDGGSEDPVSRQTQALTSADADVLDHETLPNTGSGWTAGGGITIARTNLATSRSWGLEIRGNGWRQVKSPPLSSLGSVSGQVHFDLRPASAAQAWNEAGLIFRVPSRGINWEERRVNIGSLSTGIYSTLTLNLGTALTAALAGAYTDLEIYVLVNGNLTVQVDNIRFSGVTPPSDGSGGSGGGGQAGSGGSGGSGDSGGSGGLAGGGAGGTTGASVTYSISLPSQTSLDRVALSASESLRINDRSSVLDAQGEPASAANTGSGTASLGVDSVARSLFSVGNVELRRTHLTGSMLTSGEVTFRQEGTQIDGEEREGTNLGVREVSRFTVTYPTPGANVQRNADAPPIDLSPGSYGALSIGARTSVRFLPGTYYFTTCHVEASGKMRFANASGVIEIHCRNALVFNGLIEKLEVARYNVLFTSATTGTVEIHAPFTGTIVAPFAKINLATSQTSGHTGSFFARQIEVHQDTVLKFRPFRRPDCATGTCGRFGCQPEPDADADGVSDCSEQSDGNPASDPAIFNGLLAAIHSCDDDDELCAAAEQAQCLSRPPLRAKSVTVLDWMRGFESCQDEFCRDVPIGSAIATLTGDLHLLPAAYCFAVDHPDPGNCSKLTVGNVTVESGGAEVCITVTSSDPVPIRLVDPLDDDERPQISWCPLVGGVCTLRPFDPTVLVTLPDGCPPAGGCSDECKCDGGEGPCSDGTECAAGLVCQDGIGEYYGLPAGASVCVSPECAEDPGELDCRTTLRPCGSNADCAFGQVCSSNVFDAMGISSLPTEAVKACWNEGCESGELTCGGLDAVCGRCLCHPSCADKQCGDELFDGCNEFCEPVCEAGQPGCKKDQDCPLNHVCQHDVGAAFGHAPDDDICVPVECLSEGTPDEDCGETDDRCGSTCIPAYAPCQGMTCGNDPRTGTSCGACTAGLVCTMENVCAEPNDVIRFRSRPITYEVGSTPGGHDVTPFGQSTYSIPLRLPPGARGLTPSLALVFGDLGNQRGILGPGWTLAGLSRVHRCAVPGNQNNHPTRAQDGLSKDFCVDGRPLSFDQSLTDAAGDPDVRVYRFAENDRSKVIQYLNVNSGEGFELHQPDGTVFVYGWDHSSWRRVESADTPGTREIDSWHLFLIRDVFGNNARFTYAHERSGNVDSAIYLTRIEYSRHDNSTAARRINFAYEEKEDSLGTVGGYHHHVRVDDSRLLSEITVDTFDGAQSHERDRVYSIAYETTPGSGLRRVSSVQECTAYDGGEKCLAPTRFEYDDAAIPEGEQRPRRFSAPATGVISVAGESVNFIRDDAAAGFNPAIPLDVDGDGHRDLIRVDRDLHTITYWHAEVQDGTVTFPSPVSIVGPSAACLSGGSVVDLDGDGRDEILDGCPLARSKNRVAFFNIDAVGNVVETVTNIKALGGVYVVDVEGNGKPNIVQETENFLYAFEFSHYNDGAMLFSGLDRFAIKGLATQGSGQLEPLLVDVDGDGIANLMRFDLTTRQFLAFSLASDDELTSEERNAIDVGVVGEASDPQVFIHRIARWTPTGLSYQVTPLTGGPGHYDSVRVLDINGDGLQDVWVQSALLRAPLDPNLGRIPDILSGDEPNFAGDIARINRLIGPYQGGDVFVSGPSHLWINVGGSFKLKGSILDTENGQPFSCPEEFQTTDNLCPMLLSPFHFRTSTVMDYDNDGRDDLLALIGGEWRIVRLHGETASLALLEWNTVQDLPAEPLLYFNQADQNQFDFFQSYPVWSDFDGDANLDMLIAGMQDLPEQRLIVMGTGQGNGRRLKQVTDGLGNKSTIFHTKDGSSVDTAGSCHDSIVVDPPRCLKSIGTVVSRVERSTATGEDVGETRYEYGHPAVPEFLQGYYFTETTRIENTGATAAGERLQIARVEEKFEQARVHGGIGDHKYVYPFLTSPTRRETQLSRELDLDGVPQGRLLVEEFFWDIHPTRIPLLSDKTFVILDEYVDGSFETLRRYDSYSLDFFGSPDLHEQVVYSWQSSQPISQSTVSTVTLRDEDRWILNKVRSLRTTHTRGGVTQSKLLEFDHYDETGAVRTKTEDRVRTERDLVTHYEYDTFGNIRVVRESSVDEERVTTTDYEPRGIYPKIVQNAAGHLRQFEFDDLWGNPTLIEDQNGFKTLQSYDGFGRLVRRESDNDGVVTRVSDIVYTMVPEPYEAAGLTIPAVMRKTITSDLFSGEMTEDYDSRGLLVRAKAPAPSVDGETQELFSETVYDWAGRPVMRSDAHEGSMPPVWTTVAYDLRGRPIETTTPRGSRLMRYSSSTNYADRFPAWVVPDAIDLVGVTDESGMQAASIFDYNGDTVATAEGVMFDDSVSGYITRTVRGPMNLPIALIDPEQHETRTVFDEDGRVSSTQDENRGVTEFNYDAFGNMKHLVDPDLEETEFTYDRLNRPLTRTDLDGLTQWAYDSGPQGTLSETIGPTGIRTVFGYEDSARALPTSVTRHIGDEVFTSTTEFDVQGRPQRMVYPAVEDFSLAVRNAYDPYSGRLIAVQSDDRSRDYWRISDTDAQGRIAEVTLGNGVRESYVFDPSSQLLSDSSVTNDAGGELNHISYAYYANGQVLQRSVDHGGISRSREIIYDPARRIRDITESGPGALDETFDFSPAGRLVSRTKFGEYAYDEDDRPHALRGVDGNEFHYDQRGNQEWRSGPEIPGGTQTLAYTRANLPSSIKFGDPEAPDKEVTFEYDASGQRVIKRESGEGPEILSIGSGYERTSVGGSNPSRQHRFRIFAYGKAIAQLVYDEATEESEISYLHRDHQLSVVFTTDAQGVPSELRDFDVFGQALESPGWTDVTRESFSGHIRDEESGLINAGARLYDSLFGVFTSADPLRVSGAGSQGLNPYAYANNDPVNLIDPTGLQATPNVNVYGCRPGGGGPYCNMVEQKASEPAEPVDWTLYAAHVPTPVELPEPTYAQVNSDARVIQQTLAASTAGTAGLSSGQYRLTSRRYAPFAEFGGGFQGDSRTAADPTGTYRVGATMVVDFASQTAGQVELGASKSVGMSGIAELTQLLRGGRGMSGIRANAPPSVSWHSAGKVTVDLYYWGNNGLFHGALGGLLPSPLIDTRTEVTFERSEGLLEVFGIAYGDSFPNAEFYVTDPAGNAAIIGNFATSGGQMLGVLGLFGSGVDQPFTRFYASIGLDSAGNFIQ